MAEEARPVAILGVGNRMRGDDAVGCLVCDALVGIDNAYVFDCGNTPENYLQPIADRQPGRILVVDSCDFKAGPGEFRVFSRPEIEDLSYGLLSTHTLPLTLTIEMLSLETRTTVELLGIQPASIEFGTELSDPVRRALPAVIEFVRGWARAKSI